MTRADKQLREDILRKAHDWRALIEGPDATDADRKAFEAWRAADPRHDDIYDYAITFHHALGALNASDLDEDVLRRTPREYLTGVSDRVGGLFKRTGFRIGAAGAALASVVLTVLIIANSSEGPGSPAEQELVASYETAIGETRAIPMEDGTVITLGAASAVETAYSEIGRKAVVIAGSAFFDVATAPNRPFTVQAGDLEVRVVGTVFDVSRRDETVRVAVAEGDVEVSHPYTRNEELTGLRTRKSLTAGQQISATPLDGLASIEPVKISTIGAWREDKLFYNGAPLSDLIADANRYSEARVVIEGDVKTIANYSVRGSFNARDIDGMLSTLADIYPVDIDRSEPGLVRIYARRDGGR